MAKKALLIFMALWSLGQWGIGVARADTDSYLAKLNSGEYLPGLSFNQPPSVLTQMGYRVCANTSAGMEQRAMIRDVLNNRPYRFDAVQATALVNIAQAELC